MNARQAAAALSGQRPSPRETAANFLDRLQADFDTVSNQLRETTDKFNDMAAIAAERNHTIDELTNQLESVKITQSSRDDYWKQQLHEANRDRMLYLRYSVELSAQIQFVVAGCTRALKLAGTVQSLYADLSAAGSIPDVPEADVNELERIMRTIAERAPRVDALINDSAKVNSEQTRPQSENGGSSRVTIPKNQL